MCAGCRQKDECHKGKGTGRSSEHGTYRNNPGPLPREGLDGSEGSQTKTLFTGFGLWDRGELSNHTGQRVGMGC